MTEQSAISWFVDALTGDQKAWNVASMSTNFSHAYVLLLWTNCTLMCLCVCVYILLHGSSAKYPMTDNHQDSSEWATACPLQHVHAINTARVMLTMPATTAAAAIICQSRYAFNLRISVNLMQWYSLARFAISWGRFDPSLCSADNAFWCHLWQFKL